MPERSKRVIINLNSLFGSTSPTPQNFDEYWRRLQNQLPADIKNTNITFFGTSPPWLLGMIIPELMAFAEKISWIGQPDKDGVLFEYLLHPRISGVKPRKTTWDTIKSNERPRGNK